MSPSDPPSCNFILPQDEPLVSRFLGAKASDTLNGETRDTRSEKQVVLHHDDCDPRTGGGFFFIFYYLFIYFYLFGCTGSLLQCAGSFKLWHVNP